MNRMVGKYKNRDIKIESLYLTETYEGLLVGRKDDERRNVEIVNAKIDKETSELFGFHTPHCIANYDDIDYKKPLPREVVYANLVCHAPIKEGDGSHLVLAWFQDHNQDPFTMASEKIKTIDWEKKAEDFEY